MVKNKSNRNAARAVRRSSRIRAPSAKRPNQILDCVLIPLRGPRPQAMVVSERLDQEDGVPSGHDQVPAAFGPNQRSPSANPPVRSRSSTPDAAIAPELAGPDGNYAPSNSEPARSDTTEIPWDDLPFFSNFTLFHEESAEDQVDILARLQPAFQDCDKWEISMSPDQYLRHFPSLLSTVRISSHTPPVKKLDSDDPASQYEDWMLLAEANHQIWVAPDLKEGIIAEIKRWRTIQLATTERQISYGSLHLPVRLFIDCLNKAECHTIRLKQYGQKLPLVPQFTAPEPAQVNHPLVKTNAWDIGTTVPSEDIWLFAPAKGTAHDVELHSILIPASKDYGTICMYPEWQGVNYKVKVYPRMVHVIKSINSKLQGQVPRQVRSVRTRGDASLEMIQKLSAIPRHELGGFRIEVSVTANTLLAARQLVNSTPFLDINFWLQPTLPGYNRFQLHVKITTQDTMINNAQWMYNKAKQAGVYSGQNAARPSELALQGMIDVLAALGWNNGSKDTTPSMAVGAWWREIEETLHTGDAIAIKGHLLALFKTPHQQLALLNTMRSKSCLGYVPCRMEDKDDTHRYQVRSKNPFRLRCGNEDCHHNLQVGEAVDWFAQMIVDGLVDREDVGMAPPEVPITPPRPARQHAAIGPRIFKPERPYKPEDVVTVCIYPRYVRSKDNRPDGNCLFSAVARVLPGYHATHQGVRKAALGWIRDHRADFEEFIGPDADNPMPYVDLNDYLRRMSRDGEYGDALCLEAICSVYKVTISIYRWDATLNAMDWAFNGVLGRGMPVLKLYLRDQHYENLFTPEEAFGTLAIRRPWDWEPRE